MMIAHYLKVAVRHLLKHKVQSVISLVGVAVALLCFSICLYCSRYIFSTNGCFVNRGRIVELKMVSAGEDSFGGLTPSDLVPYLREQKIDGVESFCKVIFANPRPFNVEVTDEKVLPHELNVMEVDSAYHSVFLPKVICGSWEAASHIPNSLVLTEHTARRIFGEASLAIGRRFTMTRRLSSSPATTPRTGGIVYTVQAVIGDIPANTTLAFLQIIDALVLNDSEGLIYGEHRNSVVSGYSYALLRPGMNAKDFAEDLKKRNLRFSFGARNREEIISAAPFGQSVWKNSSAAYPAWITLVTGVLILLIGLLNFFHFLAGSFLTRIREYAIRQMSGACGRNLFFMLFIHAALLILLSGFLACLLIEVMTPQLDFSLFSFSITFEKALLLGQTGEYIGGMLVLAALICAAVVGRVRRMDIQSGLFGGSQRYGQHRLRNVLLSIQIFICWVFLSMAAALYLLSYETGRGLFPTLSIAEKERIISIPFDYTFMTNAEKERVIGRIRQVSGVEDVLLADISYLDGISGTGIQTEKGNWQSGINVNVICIEPKFFQFMNMKIQSGETVGSMSEIVIDRKLADKLGTDVLGKTYYNYTDDYTVTGVCETFVTDLYSECPGYLFLPIDFSEYIGHCYVKCAPGHVGRVKREVTRIMQEALPENIVYRPVTFMDDIRRHQSLEFTLRGIVLFLSVVALAISLLGVYSAITLDTEYRRKEMAIRKINGAGIRQIAMLFARLYVWMLTGTAAVAFMLVAGILHKLRQMYTLFFDDGILFYAGIFLSVCLLMTVTVFFRIRQIARVSPAEEIRK